MDAMVNGGNSGGPIFKPGTGEVVGVVVQSVTIKSRVLTDPAGPDAEKPSPLQDPASGIFFQQQIPTGLSRGIHIHQAAQLIIDAAAGLN
jgi:S1-C subfamily serine protease